MAITGPDDRVGRLAVHHHGLVTRDAALRCGLSDRQIERRVAQGRWERAGRGVYRIAGAPVTGAQRCYAAVLAAGEHAVAASLSALALFGVGAAPLLPRIIVPPTASARTRNVLVRRSPLADVDRTYVGPIPCTTPARSLLDAAATPIDQATLHALVDDVLSGGLARPSGVIGAIRRAPRGAGRKGARRLREALAPWLEGVTPDSPAEVRLLRRLQQWGFPPPVRQHEVCLPSGRVARLDVAWPAHRVALEYDGHRAHGPRQLAYDVAREEALAQLGWWIGRVDRYDLQPSSTRIRDELAVRLVA